MRREKSTLIICSEKARFNSRKRLTKADSAFPPTTFFSSCLRQLLQTTAYRQRRTQAPRECYSLFIMSPLIKYDLVRKMNTPLVVFFRRNRVEAEGLPGLHPVAEAEREDARSGGACKDYAWCSPWMSGSLQQLRAPVSEPGPVPRQASRLCLWLWHLVILRYLLPQRWGTYLQNSQLCFTHHTERSEVLVIIS